MKFLTVVDIRTDSKETRYRLRPGFSAWWIGYDNMTSGDSNGNNLSGQEALKEIAKSANRQFVANLVNDFVKFKKEGMDGSSESTAGVMDNETDESNKKTDVREMIIGIMQKYKNGEIELPVLPKIVQEIQSVIKDPFSTVDNLVQVIERDAAITTRLVSIANSPIYRGTEKYTTAREAIPRLGVKEIQNIISAIAAKNLYETKDDRFKKLMEKLWSHSLACGYNSRAIAKSLRLGDQDKIFFMGLLHDVGKLPLLKSLSEVFYKNGSLDMQNIISNIQVIHSSFGGFILERWGYNKELIEIARQHEKEKFSENTEKTILVVSLANVLTRKLGYSLFDNNIDPSETESAKQLELSPEVLDTIIQETEKLMQDAASFN